jgi:hypothetical protein
MDQIQPVESISQLSSLYGTRFQYYKLVTRKKPLQWLPVNCLDKYRTDVTNKESLENSFALAAKDFGHIDGW